MRQSLATVLIFLMAAVGCSTRSDWGSKDIAKADSACQKARVELANSPSFDGVEDRAGLKVGAETYGRVLQRVHDELSPPPSAAPRPYKDWVVTLQEASSLAANLARDATSSATDLDLDRSLEHLDEIVSKGGADARGAGLKVCGSPLAEQPDPDTTQDSSESSSPDQLRLDWRARIATACSDISQSAPARQVPHSLDDLANFLDQYVPFAEIVDRLVREPLPSSAESDEIRSLRPASAHRISALHQLRDAARSRQTKAAEMALGEVEVANAEFNSAASKIGLEACMVTSGGR